MKRLRCRRPTAGRAPAALSVHGAVAVLAVLFALSALVALARGMDGVDDYQLYPRAYVPGVADSAAAAVIAIAAGQEVDLGTLALQPTGGTIRGSARMSGGAGQTPMAAVGVLVEAVSQGRRVIARTGAGGVFVVSGVPAGRAIVRYSTDDPLNRSPLFAAVFHPGVPSLDLAQRIEVVDGALIDLPAVELRPGCVLGGVVRTADTALPLPGLAVWVEAVTLRREGAAAPAGPVCPAAHRDPGRTISFPGDGGLWRSTTGDDGRFLQGGLPPGSYTVRVVADGTDYIGEYLGGAREFSLAATITLRAGDDRRDLELRPDRGGALLGLVRLEGSMAPLPGLEVRVIEAVSGEVRSGETGPFGAYRVGGLPTATYIVYVPALRKYYPDTYKREEARAVRVDEPAEVGGVNLTGVPGGACQLSPIARGTITGRVFGPALSVDTLRVRAWSDRDTVEAAVGDGGNYAVTCLPAGSYRVALLPAGRVRAQYHPRVYLPAQAVPVSVAAAETTDAINFDPEAGIVLTGRVLDGVTGSALAGVRVRAVELATREEAWSRTDESGSFVLDRRGGLTQGSMRTGLPAGRWRVEADSTLVPDPTVTPVWQPSLEARRVDAGIELRWSLAEEATWAVRMERERADGSATLILQRDVAPGGSGEFIDRPEEAGRVRYALSAWPQWPGAEPGPGADEPYRAWSDWIEPAGSGSGAPGGAIGRIRALPTPWARERPLLLRCIPGPVSGGTLDLIAATGRRVTELRWPAGADEISWNGRDREGRRVPSGLYLCRLRTGGSVAATGTILLLDSAP